MIVEKLFYAVKCDNCGNESTQENDAFWLEDKSLALLEAEDSDWIIRNTPDNKHLCPDCWSYDDNDNIVIKPV